jgi:RNA polymerase sigma factor (sigma-70 family)
MRSDGEEIPSTETSGGDGSDRSSVPDFESIFDKYAGPVYNYICYQAGDVHEADDIVSITFEKIYLNLARYDPRRAAIASWVFSIAANSVRDYRRSRKRKAALSLETVREREAGSATPEDEAVGKDAAERLMKAVAGLKRREREAVAMKFAGGLSNKSIALSLRMREGNVAVLLYRAVRRLREELDEEDFR